MNADLFIGSNTVSLASLRGMVVLHVELIKFPYNIMVRGTCVRIVKNN
jgi:hypothetical protein